jgi:FAD/FMN-containing dehydrogenase
VTTLLPPPQFRGAFRTDVRARAAYSEGAGIYRILPEAISLPETAADLEYLACWAGERDIPLVTRGAGSAVSGSNVGAGVIVDLTRMRPVAFTIDPSRRRAVTGSSVTYQALADAARAHGLRLPPDPASGAFATLGGMVATNAAGARSVKYGPVRPWVHAVELVTADGDSCRLERGVPARASDARAVARFTDQAAPALARSRALIQARFPHTRKNTAGFALDAYSASGDLIDLVIGSEGTLGIITHIEWNLIPLPNHIGGLLIQLRDIDSLADVVTALGRLDPSAVELLDRSFLEVLPPDERPAGDAVLLVEFEAKDARRLRGLVGDGVRAVDAWAVDVSTALSAAEFEDLWRLRHAASPILAGLPDSRRSLQVIEDGCVPLDRLTTYLRFIRTQAEELGLPVVIFGHAGDGHLHVNVLPDMERPGWKVAVAALMTVVTDEVLRLGGTPAGEHGDGRLRAGLVERLYGPDVTTLFALVKTAFDPRGILNPGVILPQEWAPLDHLKAGPHAAVLPPDIAEALRTLERSAGYGQPRIALADRN